MAKDTRRAEDAPAGKRAPAQDGSREGRGARPSLAAGAERASEERSRRQGTPLIGPAASAQGDGGDAATRPPRSGKHRPVPRVTSQPTKKARRQTGERRAASRRTPLEKRAADERARSHLHVAPPPIAPPRARSGETAHRDTAHGDTAGGDASRWDDAVHAAIAVLRGVAEAAGIAPEDAERGIAEVIAFVRRRLEGDYTVDEFGYDEHFLTHVILPLLRPIYRSWFRVDVRGAENIPAEGPALLVANHSGTVAIDGLMLQVAVHDETPAHRSIRTLGANLVFETPVLGTWARRGGATLATNADADRLLAKGELVAVFPEGFKGVGKPFTERYKLQRFGRGGFVSSALKAEVPIVPCSIVGAEEIAPIIGNMSLLARLIGVPYVPITPTFPLLGPLGLIPLPSKWIIEFGAPIPTDTLGSAAADDPMLVFDLTDQVRETIQRTLYALLMRRRSVFF